MPSSPLPSALRDLADHRAVHVAITDLDGVLRGKRISPKKLEQVLATDLGFCNVIFGWDINDQPYDNTELSGWTTGYPDATVTLDPHTLRSIPWLDGAPFLLGDLSEGSLADACPRSVLRRVLAKAEHQGYRIKAAIEYEWFLFAETPDSLAAKHGTAPTPATPGMHGYSTLRPGNLAAFVDELWTACYQFGVPLEGLHTETGPGVYEAAIEYTDALEAADRAACFKYLVRQVAMRHGMIASFMAKWRDDLPGCGGHVHQSVEHLASGRNVFAAAELRDAEQRRADKGLADAYLAGQLSALPRILPLLAPSINSYKRLVPGSWAATAMSWGHDNRTTALRLLHNRLETRLPGADANPYLALAACVATGMRGIVQGEKLKQQATTGNAYDDATLPPLPRSLASATRAMRTQQSLAAELLGEEFVEHFLRTREWEVRQAQCAVTDWERRRYLELI